MISMNSMAGYPIGFDSRNRIFQVSLSVVLSVTEKSVSRWALVFSSPSSLHSCGSPTDILIKNLKSIVTNTWKKKGKKQQIELKYIVESPVSIVTNIHANPTIKICIYFIVCESCDAPNAVSRSTWQPRNDKQTCGNFSLPLVENLETRATWMDPKRDYTISQTLPPRSSKFYDSILLVSRSVLIVIQLSTQSAIQRCLFAHLDRLWSHSIYTNLHACRSAKNAPSLMNTGCYGGCIQWLAGKHHHVMWGCEFGCLRAPMWVTHPYGWFSPQSVSWLLCQCSV